MQRALRWYDYITINVYYLGLTTLAQTNGLVFPLLVQQFVGEQVKGTFLGSLRLWSLMVALLVQALMGLLSDRSTLPWGRRRPFILIGTLANLVLLSALAFATGLTGSTGYWALFVTALVMSVASNTAHGAEQGLIPDLVPENKRGRFSGIKAVLEIPLPLILVSFTIARMIGRGNMALGIGLAAAILVICMLLTMLAPERRLAQAPGPFNWTPIVRLALMTALFTAIILGMGQSVRWTGALLAGEGSVAMQVLVMGGLGLLAMAIAVALGVWASVQLSIGRPAAAANPSFTWWVVNRLAFLVGTTNLSTFAVYFIQGRLGIPGTQAATPAALLMMVVGVFILVSALPSGWLADRFGRKPLVAISGALAGLGTVIALTLPSLTVIYVGGCLIGVAAGLFFTANWALGTELVPKAEAGRYLGISNLAGAGAGAVGAYIGGPLADYFTVHVPQVGGLGYVVLFAIYGALFLLSTLALTRVHAPAQQPSANLAPAR